MAKIRRGAALVWLAVVGGVAAQKVERIGVFDVRGAVDADPVCDELQDLSAIYLPENATAPEDITFVAYLDLPSTTAIVQLLLECPSFFFTKYEGAAPYTYSGDFNGVFLPYGASTPAPEYGLCSVKARTTANPNFWDVDYRLKIAALPAGSELYCCVRECSTCDCANPLAPTTLPTVAPSSAPTVAPSPAPTALPTFVPSAAPTLVPTISQVPSPEPTVSHVPSAMPTPVPSPLPSTSVPSSVPTSVPSPAPTTSAPSFYPTWSPTHFPTWSPTTAKPSHEPTPEPTHQPTVPGLSFDDNGIALLVYEAGVTNSVATCGIPASGGTISLSGKQATILVETTIPGVSGVKFTLKSACAADHTQTEGGSPPYALFGDTANDLFFAGLEVCAEHTLDVVVWNAGPTVKASYDFKVVDFTACEFGCACDFVPATPRPTFLPTAPLPVNSPVQPPPSGGGGQFLGDVSKIFLVESNNPNILPLDYGNRHMLWLDGSKYEPEVWFHEAKEYNIAVEVANPAVAHLILTGFYYRYYDYDDNGRAELNYNDKVTLTQKIYSNVGTAPNWYGFLDGSEPRTKFGTAAPSWRWAAGKVFLEAGEFHLTAKAYDSSWNQMSTAEVTTDIYANCYRGKIIDGDTVYVKKWKDVLQWQENLRKSGGGDDLVSQRDFYFSTRISQVTYFGSYVYIVHEKWGVVIKVSQWDNSCTTCGMSLFLDIKAGMQQAGTDLGKNNYMHSGVRSVAFHPDGDDSSGRMYASAMEPEPSSSKKQEFKNKGYYIESDSNFNPINEESVLIEFLYENGKGQPWTYRLLFRAECPVYDHTIRQIMFGVDKSWTSVDESKLLYVLHGDGSVESVKIGDPQLDDALGKILRIDPLDGKWVGATLGDGEYDTSMNPFKPWQKVTVATVSPLSRNSVPAETFAIGFRNPHTMTFANDGTFIVGEAGRDTFEEINIVEEGDNYGWAHFEGTWKHLNQPDGQTDHMFYSSIPQTDADYCAECDFRFPVVEVGHSGYEGMQYNAVALAGGHVVENSSPLGNGRFFYCDFPYTGEVWYSYLWEMKEAQKSTKGKVSQLKQAPIYRAKISEYGGTPTYHFRDIAYSPSNTGSRLDMRIGRDKKGTLYFSSKDNAEIWRVENSVP